MSRTKQQRAIAKRRLKKAPGTFEPIDLATRDHPLWMTRAYANNRYVVMIEDHAQLRGTTMIKAMIQRHDDRPLENHWAEIQRIKNELFGHEATAIELFPPTHELIDCANIYWIWILPAGWMIHADPIIPRTPI